MIKIEFTKDFANKSKGEVLECGNHLANTLIRFDKVAKVYKPEQKKKK